MATWLREWFIRFSLAHHTSRPKTPFQTGNSYLSIQEFKLLRETYATTTSAGE